MLNRKLIYTSQGFLSMRPMTAMPRTCAMRCTPSEAPTESAQAASSKKNMRSRRLRAPTQLPSQLPWSRQSVLFAAAGFPYRF